MKKSIFIWAALASSCTSLDAKKSDPANFPIIDVHTHTDFDGKPYPDSEIENSLGSYLAARRRAGVVASISHGARENRKWMDLSRYDVIQCYGIGNPIDYADVQKELRNGHYRCIKIYLGYVAELYPKDEPYRKLYRIAERFHVPVVFHTGDTFVKHGKVRYGDPLGIDEVAVDFPNVNFVIAHMGNPWIESAAEVAYKNSNVFIEGSAFLIGKIDQQPPEKLQEYVVKPIRWVFGYIEDPSKVMFGTDWPHADIKPYLELYKQAIPRQYWCDVFFNNAVRVFGFKLEQKCDPKSL